MRETLFFYFIEFPPYFSRAEMFYAGGDGSEKSTFIKITDAGWNWFEAKAEGMGRVEMGGNSASEDAYLQN